MTEQKTKKITLRFTEEEFRELDGKRAALGKKFQILGEELFLAQWLRQHAPPAQAVAAYSVWPASDYPTAHQKYHEQLEKLLGSDDSRLSEVVMRLLDFAAPLDAPKTLPKPSLPVQKAENESVCCLAG